MLVERGKAAEKAMGGQSDAQACPTVQQRRNRALTEGQSYKWRNQKAQVESRTKTRRGGGGLKK